MALLAALLWTAQSTAAPSDLDPAFGVGGAVVSDLAPIGALQPDGKLIVVGTTQQATGDPNRPTKASWSVRRYNVDGSLDLSFGQNIGGAQVVSFDVSFPNFSLQAPNVLGDDEPTSIFVLARGFVIAGTSRYCIAAAGGPACYGAVIVAHFNPDGTLDGNYGSGGKTVAMNAFADSAALQSDGKLVTLQNLSTLLGGNLSPRLVRFDAAGSPDPTFVPSVACGGNGMLRLTQDDKIVVATHPASYPFDAGFCFARLNPDGTKDTGFGTNGVSIIDAGERVVLYDFFADGGGDIVASGRTALPVVFRLRSDGSLDTAFDSGGTVGIDALQYISAVAGDCRGRTLVAGPPASGESYFLIQRVLQDGSIDPAFSAVPPPSAPVGLSSDSVGSMLVRPNGRIVALAVSEATSGSELDILQYQGDSPCASTVAVEYYYADWNYYFETAFPDEIAALDAGAFGGAWKRTGETFNVWPQANASSSPTCRFFSTAFAPKSSHFYTPFPAECATLKANPGWQFEAIAFYLQIPTGYGSGNGSCPQGTVPLYRAYNNGMGGAPNHRYTTNVSTLNAMIAQGWTFEGEANTKVFACVPQ